MSILKDEALVLRVYEQSNTSQIVVFLGKTLGPFRVYAKGARRWHKAGFEGGFDLLMRGEVLAYPRPGESMWILKEWEERARPALGNLVDGLNAASYICELSSALTAPLSGSAQEGTAATASSEALFELIATISTALESGADAGLLLLAFTMKALALEGLAPDLEHCHHCEALFFPKGTRRADARLDELGLSCRPCLEAEARRARALNVPQKPSRGIWISPETHRVLLHLQRGGGVLKISVPARAQLAHALVALVHGALEHDLRTLREAALMVRNA